MPETWMSGHGRWECKHGFLVLQCRCIKRHPTTIVSCERVPDHATKLAELKLTAEAKHKSKRKRREDEERADTVAMFDTKEKRDHWREVCSYRWDSGDFGRRVMLAYMDLLEEHEKPKVYVPPGHDCDRCGATLEQCEEHVRMHARGCCSACYSTDTHGMSLNDWEIFRLTKHGMGGR